MAKRERIPAPKIVTCREWGAAKPAGDIVVVGRPDKVIVHHTDGHAHPDRVVAHSANAYDYAYPVALQRDMQERRGWIDSGHNFLVMRSGTIFQGRWGSVTAIEHGRMVESAHCPGQNGNPGIEHEHLPGEDLTDAQRKASVWLMAWICDRCGLPPTNIFPHSAFYPTLCPADLTGHIPHMRVSVAALLNRLGRSAPLSRGRFFTQLAVQSEIHSSN